MRRCEASRAARESTASLAPRSFGLANPLNLRISFKEKRDERARRRGTAFNRECQLFAPLGPRVMSVFVPHLRHSVVNALIRTTSRL